MKKVWRLLVTHMQKDFSATYYGASAVLLTALIIFNYQVDFEDRVLEKQPDLLRFLCYFLFYGTGYFGCLFVLHIVKPGQQFFYSAQFWKYSLFGLGVLSLDSAAPFLFKTIHALAHPLVYYYAYKVIINGISLFLLVLPLLLFYYKNDRSEKHFYGLSNQRADLSPYWQLLLLMVPLLVAASFLKDFQQQYPMYKPNLAYQVLNVPEWLTVTVYELTYGFDFITVELLFRGFFVIGMIKVLGRNAIVPMAFIYCMLHFGKPMGEAISSIFGGYILGVVAYETRSIWGGIIVHMGIAWLMEALAFGQKLMQ